MRIINNIKNSYLKQANFYMTSCYFYQAKFQLNHLCYIMQCKCGVIKK